MGTPQSGPCRPPVATLSRHSVRVTSCFGASSTLGSLARLSLALPSISIPSSVADGVSKTVAPPSVWHAIRWAAPRDSRTLGSAEAEAERAFFEKSMVGQLYFPDEHKIAAYLPLLGPVGVPLVMGLINEFKAREEKEKGEMEKELEKKSNDARA